MLYVSLDKLSAGRAHELRTFLFGSTVDQRHERLEADRGSHTLHPIDRKPIGPKSCMTGPGMAASDSTEGPGHGWVSESARPKARAPSGCKPPQMLSELLPAGDSIHEAASFVLIASLPKQKDQVLHFSGFEFEFGHDCCAGIAHGSIRPDSSTRLRAAGAESDPLRPKNSVRSVVSVRGRKFTSRNATRAA